jgi:hypothetical protein
MIYEEHMHVNNPYLMDGPLIRSVLNRKELDDEAKRYIVFNYIFYVKGYFVDQVMTARIRDRDNFEKNVKIALDYFHHNRDRI